MFEIGADWVLKFSRSGKATLNPDTGKIIAPISPIEPDIVFTKPIIGVYVTSASSPKRWYAAGDLLQAYLVPFGESGYAAGSLERCVLFRYHIFNFDKFPYTKDSRYLISFDPRRYIKDIQISVWEYVGTGQPVSNEELLNAVNATHQTVRKNQSSINELIKRMKK